MIGLPVNQGTLKQRNLLSGIPATHRPPRPRNAFSLSHGGEWHMISAPRLTITSHGAPQKLILRAGMLKANGATVHCHAFQVVRLQKGRPAFSLSPIRERHMTNAPRLMAIRSPGAPQKLMLRANIFLATGATVHCSMIVQHIHRRCDVLGKN